MFAGYQVEATLFHFHAEVARIFVQLLGERGLRQGDIAEGDALDIERQAGHRQVSLGDQVLALVPQLLEVIRSAGARHRELAMETARELGICLGD